MNPLCYVINSLDFRTFSLPTPNTFFGNEIAFGHNTRKLISILDELNPEIWHQCINAADLLN